MATDFPGADDVFTEPSSPGTTALSSAGTGSRNHTQHHRDLGDAIEAMQAQATLLVHSHDGSTARHGSKLAQANTHQSPDTDTGTGSLHHTIGTGANQAAAGNHTHTQAQSHGSPDTDTGTGSLHHTIGTGANQAAAGNHVHAHSLTIYFTSSGTFSKGSYPGLYAIEVELVGGGGGSASTGGTGPSEWGFGVGGAGGAWARAYILAASLGSSETVTIGAGGVGGSGVTGQPGTDGGTSSFGSFFSCTGGQGGNATGLLSTSAVGSGWGGRTGGSPSGTYDIGVPGQTTGQCSYGAGPVLFYTDGLSGTPSGGPYGQKAQTTRAGRPAGIGSENSLAGLGYGSGARGTVTVASDSARSGADGSAGICIVRLIY